MNISIAQDHWGHRTLILDGLFFKFWDNHYTRHTFSSCLIRCANTNRSDMKIQSGHDSVHRRTDAQTDKVKPVYPAFIFVEAGGITKSFSLLLSSCFEILSIGMMCDIDKFWWHLFAQFSGQYHRRWYKNTIPLTHCSNWFEIPQSYFKTRCFSSTYNMFTLHLDHMAVAYLPNVRWRC